MVSRKCLLAVEAERQKRLTCVSSQEDVVSNTYPVGPHLTSAAVQDFILSSLPTKESAPQRKIDVLTVFVILVFSILFIYLQKAIYFTK
ncbi:hypothetical protein NQ317_017157 [Molorchus minor]|uniref:Uncharacterized protein n=1 Tax=Molorchus minor TaxID=1323400 RepID=A0ABQ9JJ99_9CUCU|nr:hypothetical protein NQ317_017157 [Molorchus minor]